MKTFRLEVQAETKEDAAVEIRLMGRGDVCYYLQEVEEEINWLDEVDTWIQDILGQYWDDGEWQARVKELITQGETDVRELYDRLYQKFDLVDVCHEWVDGSGLPDEREALDILDQLSEYEEWDTGLWEGLQGTEVLKAQGFWTLRSALICRLEETLKDLIQKLVDAQEDEDDNE